MKSLQIIIQKKIEFIKKKGLIDKKNNKNFSFKIQNKIKEKN